MQLALCAPNHPAHPMSKMDLRSRVVYKYSREVHLIDFLSCFSKYQTKKCVKAFDKLWFKRSGKCLAGMGKNLNKTCLKVTTKKQKQKETQNKTKLNLLQGWKILFLWGKIKIKKQKTFPGIKKTNLPRKMQQQKNDSSLTQDRRFQGLQIAYLLKKKQTMHKIFYFQTASYG